jgi:hypothetical protein
MIIMTDIEKAKDDCLDAFDDEIVAARDLKNQSNPTDSLKMTDVIARLKAQRTAIAVQDYKAALTDPAMQNALAIIRGATADMTVVAGNMKTVTDFVTNLATFIGGGTKVVSALRGI